MDRPPPTAPVFVGVDVAKNRLDVHVLPMGHAFALPRDAERNTPAGLVARWRQRVVMIVADADARVRGTPAWQEVACLLTSVPGVAPVLSRVLLAEMPELGTLDRRLSNLAGDGPGASVERDAFTPPLRNHWHRWRTLSAVMPGAVASRGLVQPASVNRIARARSASPRPAAPADSRNAACRFAVADKRGPACHDSHAPRIDAPARLHSAWQPRSSCLAVNAPPPRWRGRRRRHPRPAGRPACPCSSGRRRRRGPRCARRQARAPRPIPPRRSRHGRSRRAR